MFASMLMFCEVTNPRQLWDAHWESLSDDIEAMTRCERADTAWKIFQRFPSLITSLLFMEETDWSKKNWLMISIH
jgi:hypothetical protein